MPCALEKQAGHGKVGNYMAKNIYVGNLAWGVNQDDLYELFKSQGVVAQAQVISDKETGRSRGFGFVVMQNDDEAQRAIDALNGTDFQGRPLTVNEARPREEQGGGRGGERERAQGGGGHGGGGSNQGGGGGGRGGHGGRSGGYSHRGRDY
jgi:RNA recognition motif-containing protein